MPAPKPTPPAKAPPTTKEPPAKPSVPTKEPVAKEPQTKKPATPAQEKSDAFKYDMQYANGGFNNGVEIKPARDGKIELKVSIYGGGEQKVMKISPVPDSVAKMIKAYELGADKTGEPDGSVTGGLQDYFDGIRAQLSAEIIGIMTEADKKIESAIKKVFATPTDGF